MVRRALLHAGRVRARAGWRCCLGSANSSHSLATWGGLSRHLAAPPALRVQWAGDCSTVVGLAEVAESASFNAQVCEYGGSPPPCPHSDGEADGGIGCGTVTVMLLLWSLVAGAAAGLRRFLTSTKLAPHQAARLSRKGEPRERSLCRSAAPEGTTPPTPKRPLG